MRITRIEIENFRSIRSLKMDLGDATVLIGQNNAGKTAILDAVRIVLTRRWGQRGSGFTENDVHCPRPDDDPRELPPVKITLVMEEPETGAWHTDMVAELDNIISMLDSGRNILTVQVTCAWSQDKETFDPVWQFLDAEGMPLPERRRAINLSGFFSYMPLFWLGALRDASQEFMPRSRHWGRLLRSVNIPADLEAEAMEILANLDARIVAADPKLSEIADTIGQATRIAIGQGPGAARLNTLPLGIEDMLQRTGIVLRNEELRPWLPLDHHGQGLQSLAVIFLFQAAVSQLLYEAEQPGIEPVFTIEEPEAHLHPQAARTLWKHMQGLNGQKIFTTHSPYFVQHVPLHDIRLVRLQDGCTEFSSLPQYIETELPWNDRLESILADDGSRIFFRDPSDKVEVRSWFDKKNAKRLLRCYREDPDQAQRIQAIHCLRHQSRILLTIEDEQKLGFHGRRVRGEIFFARHWILVEGLTEYLLLNALGIALDWPLDAHGVAVIDFQQSGSAGIYPALAEAFNIPWHMIVDGDEAGKNFRGQILKRGFNEDDLERHFEMLPQNKTLEDQLVADDNDQLFREILEEIGVRVAPQSTNAELARKLKNNKIGYMGILASRVANDPELVQKMPAPFVNLITELKNSAA